MFVDEICRKLDHDKIAYAIVGGYAVALHGAVRGTVDLDIVIEWTLSNLLKLEQSLKQLGLISLLPITAENLYHFREDYIQNRNLIGWNFYDPKNALVQLDVIINYNLNKKDIETFQTRKGKLKVLCLNRLIEMKKKSGRPQDLEDVKALESL
jgi:hypothetical protein